MKAKMWQVRSRRTYDNEVVIIYVYMAGIWINLKERVQELGGLKLCIVEE